MHNRLLFLILLANIFINSCYINNVVAQEIKSDREVKTQVAQTTSEDNGLVILSSPHSVLETTNRLESIIKEKNLTLFARIDHADNAKGVGEQLQPTELLIFGNPKVGTPLMQCSRTTAIDLPQKILVWSDQQQQTKIAYNQPNYLGDRHNLSGCEQILEKVSAVLQEITEQGIQP